MSGRERRGARRYSRRLSVRYGEKDLSQAGFTVDVSTTGMFVVAQRLPALQTRIHIQVHVDATTFVFYEGRVVRHVVVPPELRTVTKAGFGVLFLRPEQLLTELVPRSVDALRVTYASPDDVRRMLEQELRHGGLFIRTARPFARDAEVPVELHFGWSGKSLTARGRVVHVVPGDAAHSGVSLVVERAAELKADVERQLAETSPLSA